MGAAARAAIASTPRRSGALGVDGWFGQRSLSGRATDCQTLYQHSVSFVKEPRSDNNSLQLSAMDASARVTMKDAAKCDKRREWQNSVNQENAERILHF